MELNPVRAGLVRQAWGYEWSSAAAHAGKGEWPEWLDRKFWSGKWAAANWGKILAKEQDKALIEKVRLYTHRGRPLAGERMLAKLEGELNRRLRQVPVGRPRKKFEDASAASDADNSQAPTTSRGAHRKT
ncbi:MAG: hypothetical protein QM765_44580 [Myxococcales bacterium]